MPALCHGARMRRLLSTLTILAALAACGPGADRTLELSSERLAEIRAKSYIGGNGPGGFALARLSGIDGNTWPAGIHFTGHGPYLHEMGFLPDMMITAIDGVGVDEIFAGRWRGLRLADPSAFDHMHYKDLVEYLFVEEQRDAVTLTVDLDVSTYDMDAGEYRPRTETWRIEFER